METAVYSEKYKKEIISLAQAAYNLRGGMPALEDLTENCKEPEKKIGLEIITEFMKKNNSKNSAKVYEIDIPLGKELEKELKKKLI